MINLSKIKEEIDTIKLILLKVIPETKLIYLFGSYGTQRQTDDSDIDIAIFCEKKIPELLLWNVQQELAVALNRDVDLVDLLSIDTVFAFQILSTGTCVLASNKNEDNRLQMQIGSEYLRLNEGREAILKDIKKRGQIRE
ncbi:MAG: nucleotidyltransferase domain-containing protein [Gammaproteobacteria bacterium]